MEELDNELIDLDENEPQFEISDHELEDPNCVPRTLEEIEDSKDNWDLYETLRDNLYH